MGTDGGGVGGGAPAGGGRELKAALAALVALGAALRFSTLGVQHLWLDEAVTQGLVRLDLHDMLATLDDSESTPPLYYLLARGWVLVFGSGEVALRSLSALAGTLTIPVAYAAGTTLAGRRIGLIAAALTAVSPALVWYSQEARAYALLVLLCALSVLFTARALREGGTRALAWWAVTAMLALLTHYFAAFLVAAEGAWLVAALPARRLALAAVAAVGVVGLALLPLALHQSDQTDLAFIDSTSLATRVVDAGELFAAGPTADRMDLPAAAFVAVVALAALVLLVRNGGPEERRPLLLPASLALGATLAPLLLALAGADYVLARNLLPAWLPIALVVALGLGSRRSPRLAAGVAAVLATASLALVLAVPLDRSLQREAITAALAPGMLDAEEQRILPLVRYAADTSDRPACPANYTVSSRGAAPLSAEASYAICVRPRD